MNVLHITTHDKGGAGIAAYRVHKSLIENKINSKYLCLYKLTSGDDILSVKKNSKILNFIFKVKYKLNSLILRKTDENYRRRHQKRSRQPVGI